MRNERNKMKEGKKNEKKRIRHSERNWSERPESLWSRAVSGEREKAAMGEWQKERRRIQNMMNHVRSDRDWDSPPHASSPGLSVNYDKHNHYLIGLDSHLDFHLPLCITLGTFLSTVCYYLRLIWRDLLWRSTASSASCNGGRGSA